MTSEDPTSSGGADPIRVARAACALAGLDPANAHVIHNYANAVLLLPAEHAVARVAAGDHTAQARNMLAVTRWLSQHGYPAVTPLRDTDAVSVVGHTVTFWHYYPQAGPTPDLDSAVLGTLLRRLHELRQPPVRLRSWQPLTSLERAISNPAASPVLTDDDRDWLKKRIPALRSELAVVDWPLGNGLIHGDAWLGNLLRGNHGTVLMGDWDSAAWGPREVDLVPTWHAARRYHDDPDRVRIFTERYGYDLEESPGFELLLEMRDFVQLSAPLRHAHRSREHAEALRQRLDGTRTRRAGRWHAF
ncbi:phosphotransferase [Actinosynnema sp. CS-041913]|uniref:phosphotransferase n=1 Tax=Actinosynnema sp. CS-041913 TaxID=3239917 RepID=UPI003D8C6755